MRFIKSLYNSLQKFPLRTRWTTFVVDCTVGIRIMMLIVRAATVSVIRFQYKLIYRAISGHIKTRFNKTKPSKAKDSPIV